MKVKIIYTSLTGNTKEAVDVLSDALTDKGADVEAFDGDDGIEVDDFFTDADAYVIASYTDGDAELPDGIIDFADDVEDADLNGFNVSVIGTGDTSYDDFCSAVDDIEGRVKEAGANIIAPGLKIELAPDDEATEALKQLAATITSI